MPTEISSHATIAHEFIKDLAEARGRAPPKDVCESESLSAGDCSALRLRSKREAIPGRSRLPAVFVAGRRRKQRFRQLGRTTGGGGRNTKYPSSTQFRVSTTPNRGQETRNTNSMAPRFLTDCSSFRMTAHDFPEGLSLHGSSTEDVADITSKFRSRVAFKDADGSKFEIDRRAVHYLPLLLNDAVNLTHNELTRGTLE